MPKIPPQKPPPEKASEPPTNQKGNVPVAWGETRKRFMLTVYTTDGDGKTKRKRTFYREKEDAEREWKAHVRRVERHGKQSAAYDAIAHREYEEAKRIVPEVDLREVARFYRSHHPEDAINTAVAEAIALFQAQKESQNLSDSHSRRLKTHLDRFALTFGDRLVREVTGNETLEWVRDLGKELDPRTVWNHYDSLCNFFNWSARRGYTKNASTDDIHESDLPVIPKKPKGVLTVEQVRAMLAWLDANRPRFVAWHALQLFAGIRNAEVARMQWEWIDLKRQVITLPGWTLDRDGGEVTRVVKTGDDWVLHDLPENLWLWLEKHGEEKGPIRAPSGDAVKRMRGRRFRELPEHPIPSWPQNAMRHTFCTMMISLHDDAAKVANWSRHTNPKQLYKSYVGKLVSKEEAKEFFAIAPHSTQSRTA